MFCLQLVTFPTDVVGWRSCSYPHHGAYVSCYLFTFCPTLSWKSQICPPSIVFGHLGSSQTGQSVNPIADYHSCNRLASKEITSRWMDVSGWLIQRSYYFLFEKGQKLSFCCHSLYSIAPCLIFNPSDHLRHCSQSHDTAIVASPEEGMVQQ